MKNLMSKLNKRHHVMQSIEAKTNLHTLKTTYFAIFTCVWDIAFWVGGGGVIKELRNILYYKRE
jgi:hypothetical protein